MKKSPKNKKIDDLLEILLNFERYRNVKILEISKNDLQNEYLDAEIGFDTAENELREIYRLSRTRPPNPNPFHTENGHIFSQNSHELYPMWVLGTACLTKKFRENIDDPHLFTFP